MKINTWRISEEKCKGFKIFEYKEIKDKYEYLLENKKKRRKYLESNLNPKAQTSHYFSNKYKTVLLYFKTHPKIL